MDFIYVGRGEDVSVSFVAGCVASNQLEEGCGGAGKESDWDWWK
jgi:hypothetical protein